MNSASLPAATPASASPDPATPAVRYDKLAGHIAVVTIDRPQARNAINGEVAERLDSIVAETEADADVWVVVLTGAGHDAFSAGADLKEVAAGRGRQLRTTRGGFAGFVNAPRSKPWIAAVNGAALGGGTELALACDLVVAAAHVVFGLPEVQRGLIAGAGGLYRLPRALPRAIALELVLTADSFDAQQAHRWGLVNRVVPPEQALTMALALAERIARNAPLAVRESLRIARLSNDLTEAELQALSTEGLARVAASEDLKEGLRAFAEKRSPHWSGH